MDVTVDGRRLFQGAEGGAQLGVRRVDADELPEVARRGVDQGHAVPSPLQRQRTQPVDPAVPDQLVVELSLGTVDPARQLAQPRLFAETDRQRTDEVPDPLFAARDLEQVAIQGLCPLPLEFIANERIVERLAVRFLGVGERAIYVEDQSLETHRGSPSLNTRLASRSAAAIVVSDSSVVAISGWEYNRYACRRRARSSALRTLRALAKCGCAMRRLR